MVENPSPIPANDDPKRMPTGMYQLVDLSVGKPGSCVTAKKVPENAIIVNIGMTSAGTNADGSRRMLRRLRIDSERAARSASSSCPAIVLIVPPVDVGADRVPRASRTHRSTRE